MNIKSLPNDINLLKAMLIQQDAQNKLLISQLDSLQNQNEKLSSQIDSLLEQNKLLQEQVGGMQHQLEKLLRNRYGKKSEKQSSGKKNSKKNDDDEKKPKNKPARKPLPKDLERKRIEYEIPDQDLDCPCCGEKRKKFAESSSEQLEFIPAKLIVIEHVRFKYSCKICKGNCVEAKMPNQPIDKGIPGPRLLAEIIVNKYQDHLPLYRQELRFKRLGMELSRKTLCNWIGNCAFLLKPIVEYIKIDLLKAMKLHTDDTTIPVLDKDKAHTGRLWVYLTNISKSPPICVYEYSKSRRQKYPMKFLENYSGYLQADAYPGYNKLYESGDIIEVACFAHCRRKFDEVISQKHSSARAKTIINLIGKLYALEQHCKNFMVEERYYYRQKYAKPALKKLRRYLIKTKSKVMPKSAFGEAITYALNHWRALCNYLRHGELNIDNNAAERAIKPVVIGRKNYLFAGSHKGAEDAAIIYSIIETCKMNGINTFDYIADVLTKLPNYKASQLQELIPYHWKPSM